MPLEQNRDYKGAVTFLACLLVSCTVPVIVFSQKAIAISLSLLLLFIVAMVFFIFLVDMILDVRKRTSKYIIIFILANVATMICLFANTYRWTGLRGAIAPADKHSFWSALYFSVVTWTTVGYGDIVPGPNTRAFAAIEALRGNIVMALIIAIAVAMAQSRLIQISRQGTSGGVSSGQSSSSS